ncbi:MAG: ATP-binding protein [Bacteroidales bacterium]|nr:ATP-binding protein [Bacteroidales bacterium]
MDNIKEIPYGVADFVVMREQNLYYVDKTMYLEELERQSRFVFFIRPRRFGKSLFISMMQAYYDKAMANRFDKLFGGLQVAQKPTPNRSRYQVLYLDFSRVGGNIAQLEEKFNAYCNHELDFFIDRYFNDYPQRFKEAFYACKDAGEKINMLGRQAKSHQIPLYLIIDEYDNFTNTVLNEEGQEMYHAMTHAEGFYRDMFKKFKGNFERIFMTGVSPVTLDDVTSGFNIGWQLSTNPLFDKMLGFSTHDVREMFTYYKNVGCLPAGTDIGAMVEEIKPWYDNYCFAKECLNDKNTVFNCDMVLYYLRHYVNLGHSPEQMTDPNTKTDYAKLKRLLQLDRLDGNRKGVIQDIAEKGEIVGELYESFPAKEITNPEKFVSLLFYYGMLTIKDTKGRRLVLGIPNNNVRIQYYQYLLENYKEVSHINLDKLYDHYDEMAFDGLWRDALQYIADAYRNISSVRDAIEGERSIQGFFMAYLSLNDYYLTAPELELNHGYCDFFLMPNLTHYQSQHCYIIEIKYLPKKDFQAQAERQWQQAVEQIQAYAQAPRVEALRQGTKLHKIIMQFAGWELQRMEEVEA